jgi:hypothetical protein
METCLAFLISWANFFRELKAFRIPTGSPFVDNPNLFLVEEGFGFSFDLKQPKLLPWRTKEPIIVGKGQPWRPADAVSKVYPSKNLQMRKNQK